MKRKHQSSNQVDYHQLYSFMLNKQYDVVALLKEYIQALEENQDDVDVLAVVMALRTLMTYLINGHLVCEEVVMWNGAKDINALRREVEGQQSSEGKVETEESDHPRKPEGWCRN